MAGFLPGERDRLLKMLAAGQGMSPDHNTPPPRPPRQGSAPLDPPGKVGGSGGDAEVKGNRTSGGQAATTSAANTPAGERERAG